MYNENETKQAEVTKDEKTRDVVATEAIAGKETGEATLTGVNNSPAAKSKKKRKVSVESFSRAPLRVKEEIAIRERGDKKANGL